MLRFLTFVRNDIFSIPPQPLYGDDSGCNVSEIKAIINNLSFHP
jgi:hypothetical protein